MDPSDPKGWIACSALPDTSSPRPQALIHCRFNLLDLPLPLGHGTEGGGLGAGPAGLFPVPTASFVSGPQKAPCLSAETPSLVDLGPGRTMTTW